MIHFRQEYEGDDSNQTANLFFMFGPAHAIAPRRIAFGENDELP